MGSTPPTGNLIVACWGRQELDRTIGRGMRALAMLRCDTNDALFKELVELPAEGDSSVRAPYNAPGSPVE